MSAPRFRLRADLADVPRYAPGKSVPGSIKLASNENPNPLPDIVVAAITAAGSGGNRYPDNGAVALRESLAARLGLTAEHIAIGAGSVALCHQLAQATCVPGDEIIFAWRSFEAYPVLTRVVGATPVPVPLTADHRHDLPAMAAAVTERTRLVFVCNPNNPTGTTVTHDEIEEFLAALPDDLVVVLDEAYHEYNRQDDQPDALALVRRHPNLVVMRTFSKAYGLAGLRVGYLFGDPDLVAATGAMLIPFSSGAVAQAAALACLEVADELLAATDEIAAERTRVRTELVRRGYDVPVSQANFLWLPVGDDAAALAEHCATGGVIVRGFPGDGIRVTVSVAPENSTFLTSID